LVAHQVIVGVNQRGQEVRSALGLVQLHLAVCYFIVVEILTIGLAFFKNAQEVLQDLMAEVFVTDSAVCKFERVGEEFIVLGRLNGLDDHVRTTALQGDANGLLVLLLFEAVVEHAVDDTLLLLKLVGLGDLVVGRVPVLVVVLLHLHVLVQALVE